MQLRKLALALVALLPFVSPGKAQDVLVVATCGTLSQAYAVGSTRLPTVDVNGKLCLSGGGGGSGTVTSVSVVTANGVSGSVANPTTTPAITLTLGAITPTTVAIGAGSAITSSGPGGALTSAAFTTLGTGVATALAVNVGTAGSFVVNGGALGTPSSGVATNLTGLPLTSGVTGVLPVANGGTNCSIATIICFNNITGFTAAGTTGTTSTNLVFSTSPSITTPTIAGGTITGLTGFAIRDTSAAFDVTFAATSAAALTAGRTLTLSMSNVAHTLEFGTTANTITFPSAASYTVAGLSVANVFSAVQTVPAGSVSAPGLAVGVAGTGLYSVSTTGAALAVNGVLKLDYGVSFANEWTITSNETGGGFPNGLNLVNAGLSAGNVFSILMGKSITNKNYFSMGMTWNSNASNTNTAYFAMGGGPAVLIDGNGLFSFHGVTSSFPALKRSSATLIHRLADDSADGPMQASVGTFSSATDSTSGTTGAVIISGGLASVKRVFHTGLATSTGNSTTYVCVDSAGEIINDNAACIISSLRYKEGFASLAPQEALTTVMKLNPGTFRYKQGFGHAGQQIGFAAEQVAEVDERLIVRGADGLPKSVRYFDEIGTLNTAAIQALKAANDNLWIEIQELKRRVR